MVWNKKIKQEARWRRFKAGLILSLTIFLALSLWSYNPQDPSFNSFGLALKITNYCGFVGSVLADLFYQLFGLCSWLLLLNALFLSFKFFTNRFSQSIMTSNLLFGLVFLSISSLSELHFPNIQFYNDQVLLGGYLGFMIVAALKPLFHMTGTVVLLWSASILVLLFYGQSLIPSFLFFSPLKLLTFVFSFLKKSVFFLKLTLFQISKSATRFFSFTKILFYKNLELLKNLFFLKRQKTEKLEKKTPSSSVVSPLFSEKAHFIFKEEKLFDKKGEKTEDSKTDDLNSFQEEKEEEIFKKTKSFSSTIKQKIFSETALPSIDILSDAPSSSNKIHQKDVEDLSKKLLDKLAQFSIKGELVAVKTGPAVILFEFKPEEHIKVSRIQEMENDLSLALSSESIRVIAPIPGRDVVGIEASRPFREIVYLKNLLTEPDFFKMPLPLVLGHRADNLVGIKDLSRIPHLLIAGTTGSGKSIFVISFIISLLFRHTPQNLRLLLVDPKQVDLSAFKDIPHLLSPIITSTNETLRALNWAIIEMEKRYRSLALFEVRDQKSFNEKVCRLNDKDKKEHIEKNESLAPQEVYYFEPLPLICIIIEEFGDLMADKTSRNSIENCVVRLAQKARASGIHLVLAMQSPRKDIVTGLIKTNIPGRISFKVSSGTDSRVILDEVGAEKLLPHGDMLFLEPGNPKPFRYHSPFIREKDVTQIANYWKSQGEPCYEESLLKGDNTNTGLFKAESSDIKTDPKYNEILELLKTCDVISASYLQRRFRFGYPRAARMIEFLFEEGKIGPPQGSKPREVLINK